jgi:hypothetical protein
VTWDICCSLIIPITCNGSTMLRWDWWSSMPEYNSTTIATTTKWRRSIRWHCASCKSKFLLTIFHDFTLDFQVKSPSPSLLYNKKCKPAQKKHHSSSITLDTQQPTKSCLQHSEQTCTTTTVPKRYVSAMLSLPLLLT